MKACWEPAGLGELPFPFMGMDEGHAAMATTTATGVLVPPEPPGQPREAEAEFIVNAMACVQQLQACVRLAASRAISVSPVVCAQMAMVRYVAARKEHADAW